MLVCLLNLLSLLCTSSRMNKVGIQGSLEVSDALPLKFDLEILANTCIKCKKPWSRLAFVGEVSCFSSKYMHCFLKFCYTKFINIILEN